MEVVSALAQKALKCFLPSFTWELQETGKQLYVHMRQTGFVAVLHTDLLASWNGVS